MPRVSREDFSVELRKMIGDPPRWVQPVAENCILDEHHHAPGAVCQGCADLDPKARVLVREY